MGRKKKIAIIIVTSIIIILLVILIGFKLNKKQADPIDNQPIETTDDGYYYTNPKIEREKIESGELEVIVPEWHSMPEEDPSMEAPGSYKADNPELDTTSSILDVEEETLK